jgi:hypothetical protein
MIRHSPIVFFLAICFLGCIDKPPSNKAGIANIPKDTATYSGLHGTWIRLNKEGFTLIEIKDSSHVLYYQCIDRKAHNDSFTGDRYWYYNSTATMGYWNNAASVYKATADIWISTGQFRFDYQLKGDTLIEIDKMGDQGKFIRVENDQAGQ